MPVILWATDREGRLTLLEGAGLRALGVMSEDVIGRTPEEVHPDTRRYRRHLVLALRGRIQTVEVQLGEQTFVTRLGPLVDTNGTIVGVTGVSADVSRRNDGWRRHLPAMAANVQPSPRRSADSIHLSTWMHSPDRSRPRCCCSRGSTTPGSSRSGPES